jgi:hypothetical protein
MMAVVRQEVDGSLDCDDGEGGEGNKEMNYGGTKCDVRSLASKAV